MARPRVGSPGAPVKDAGIASPTTVNGRRASACPDPRATAQARVATPARASAEHLRRDRLEPSFCISGLKGSKLRRRVRLADAACAFHVGKDAVHRPVHTCNG